MTRPPPDGLEFLGATLSGDPRVYLLRCPACLDAAVAVVPAAAGWRLAAEVGCAGGCDETSVAWWHLWRLGELPPPPPPGDRQRRYASGAVRRILSEIPERPSTARVRRAAYDIGRFAAAGDLDPEPLGEALSAAAARAGVNADALVAALTAGRAVPARLPR